MLAAFRASEVSRLDGTAELLGIEEEIRAPIVPNCPAILGRIDLISRSRSALRLTDFKTSRSTWNDGKIEEGTPQMLIYAELARPLAHELGVEELRLEWTVITKTTQPAVEIHTLTPAPIQIARTRAVVRRVWEAISGGHFFPSPSSMSCSSCPFSQAWSASRRRCHHRKRCSGSSRPRRSGGDLP
jgi:hypothetical protein